MQSRLKFFVLSNTIKLCLFAKKISHNPLKEIMMIINIKHSNGTIKWNFQMFHSFSSSKRKNTHNSHQVLNDSFKPHQVLWSYAAQTGWWILLVDFSAQRLSGRSQTFLTPVSVYYSCSAAPLWRTSELPAITLRERKDTSFLQQTTAADSKRMLDVPVPHLRH